MSKKITSFIEENRNNIILCGESCVGKSHFADHNLNKQKVVYGNMAETLVNIELCTMLASNRVYTGGNSYRDIECCEMKSAKKGKKIIILGAPYFIWRKRVKERIVKERTGKCRPASLAHLSHVAKFTIDKYIGNHVRYIRHLIACKSLMPEKPVPYILVDNRNDYPILDESAFLTMLTEEGGSFAPNGMKN